MGEVLLMSAMIELTSIVASQGIKKYLAHRRGMIENGKESQLISTKLNKISKEVIRRMSGNSEKILEKLEEEVLPILEDTAIDLEKVYEEEVEGEEDVIRKSITEKIMDSMPKLPKIKLKRNSVGFNPALIKSFLNPIEKKPEKEIPPEFEKFVSKLINFLRDEIRYMDENDNARYQRHKDYTAKLIKAIVK